MLLFIRLLLWLLFLSPFLAALLIWLSLSATPLVPEQPSLSHQDIERAKIIVEQHQRSDGRPLQLELSERDLELAGTYLLRRHAETNLKITIQDNRLHAKATLRIPGFPSRPYLNLQLSLREQAGHPNLVHLQVSEQVLPRALAKKLLNELLLRLHQTEEYRLARSIVDELQLHDGRLYLQYHWNPELARRARATFLKEPPSARQVYRAELRRLLQQQNQDSPPLTALLAPLFQLARERSSAGDPVAENRALLAVLGYWATTGESLATQLIGQDSGPPLRFRARLNRRRDQARHFLISAALAANINDTAASLAGTLKELGDAEKGSGFSFIDLAADRAGTRFGQLAIASPEFASRLQQRMAAGVSDGDIVPAIAQLTEGVDLEEFRRRYGTPDSTQYQHVIDSIDRMIDACPVYKMLQPQAEAQAVNS